MSCEIILITNKSPGQIEKAGSSCYHLGPRSCLPLLSNHPHPSPRLSSSLSSLILIAPLAHLHLSPRSSSSLPSLIFIPLPAHPHRSSRSSSSLPSLRFFSIWLFQQMERSQCIAEDFTPTYLVYWHIVSKYHWLWLTLNKASKNVILMT
jgi:hypothetical protein